MDPATESWRLLWLCDGEPIDPMLATVAEAAGFAVVEGTATGVGVDPHGPSTVAAVPLGPDPASTFAEMRKLRGRDPHTPFLLLSATRDLPHRVPRILNDAVVGLLSPPWTAEVATALLAYAKDVRRLRERRLHPTSGDLRVLLVEDDDADAEYIGELLGPLHAHPRRAVRLQEALELVEEHSFDLMLCDLSLPDARGVDVVSALHAVRPGVPIVVITGARDEALAQEVIRIGAQDCLAKGTLDAHGLARSTRHAMERAASEQRIAFLASHDVLTGLANRRLFQAHLEQCLARARRRVEEMSTLFIDLDRFKAVNDSLGHAVGDEVLKTVARRLEAEMRDYDTIARIGGDEFAVVIDAGPSVARGISERIIASLSEPVIGPFGQASVGASVGIASFPRSGRDPVTLLRATDRAMYRAKSLGGGRAICSGDPPLEGEEDRPPSCLPVAEVRVPEALSLAYQPEVHLESGAILGWEALLRGPELDGEPLATATLLDLLLESRQMAAAGQWILAEAGRRAAEACETRRISVNVADAEFRDRHFADRFLALLDAGPLERRRIRVEVTEGALTRDLPHARRTLGALHAAGVETTVDGFGSSDCALPVTALRQLPIARVKVAAELATDTTLLRAVIALARELGFEVVAKGIEHPEQLAAVRRAGCEVGQGFLLASPTPLPSVVPVVLGGADGRRASTPPDVEAVG